MMFLLPLLICYLLIEGNLSQIFNDETLEKLYVQVHGAFHYMLDNEEMRNISRDVTFNLYTRKNPQVAQVIPAEYPSLLRYTYYDPKLKSYFVVHGYTDHKHREIIARLRLVLNNAEDCNVIVVDWGRLAALIYMNAVESTVPVGTYLGQFISELEKQSTDLKKVHLIGHSLGSHISGIAGAYVDGRVGRITGLDPAGPLFELLETRDECVSLDPSDALFVDVIHTDADEFGMRRPIGHADFYPNEGTSPQPGCDSWVTVVSCSHVRAVELYTESVLDGAPFQARHCNVTRNDDTCLLEEPVHMGHYLTTKARGIYFLETNAQRPYAKVYN